MLRFVFRIFILFVIVLSTLFHISTTKDTRDLFQFYQKTSFTTIDGRKIVPTAQIPEKENLKVKSPPAQRDLHEGALCRRGFDNKSGYCVVAHQCLHVIRDFRVHGSKIDICGYSKNVPIVCCPLEEKEAKNDEKRISARKCDQYQENGCVTSLPLIVGGDRGTTGEFPHMVALGWLTEDDDSKKLVLTWGCGGSIISELFVLTAGHCTDMGGQRPDIVRPGALDLDNLPSAKDLRIAEIIVHPSYTAALHYHDIALLKLAASVPFAANVKPICLWQSASLAVSEVIATGWGRTKFLGPRSDSLRKVTLQIIDFDLCKGIYKTDRKLPRGLLKEGQFCAGFLEGGKDTCQGDSGGPVHATIPGTQCGYFLIGITSFGKFCAAPNSPGVYTKVFSYLDWIEKYAFG